MLPTKRNYPVLKTNGELENGEDDGRDSWSGKMDFVLSIIGFAVDLANVWRFPYLCFKNGGGAFLIPYFLMLFFGALPLFYMELLVGQFHREGPITIWTKIAPLLKGIGWCTVTVSLLTAFYYNVIIGWAAFYFVHSFTTGLLPWQTCTNWWNTGRCYDGSVNSTFNLTNGGVSPANEYYENRVLGLNNVTSIDNVGAPKWDILLCTIAIFIVLFLSLMKGVKVSGKIMWVTALAPYLILLVMLIKGCTLKGAGKGIMYYITPKMEKLADFTVWRDAAYQIFFSVGAGFGVHLSYASYNKFHNNCYRDCLITSMANSFTSIFAGFVVFVYLGYLSEKWHIDIDKVAQEGPGLVFIVYPEAIATLTGGPAWSAAFFLMLITLGLDSAMGGLESVITGLRDNFRAQLAPYKYQREAVTGVIVGISCLVSISSTTYGGAYVVNLMDHFAAGFSLLAAVLFECIGIAWIYGLRQFCSDAELMLGFRPGIYWRVCWKIITPISLMTVMIASAATYKSIIYESYNSGVYSYPTWANVVGWTVALTPITFVPIYFLWKLFFQLKGPMAQRIAYGLTPKSEHANIDWPNHKVKVFQVMTLWSGWVSFTGFFSENSLDESVKEEEK